MSNWIIILTILALLIVFGIILAIAVSPSIYSIVISATQNVNTGEMTSNAIGSMITVIVLSIVAIPALLVAGIVKMFEA